MKFNIKRGISLIVLVITIVVIIILAGAIILAFTQNNPIKQANKSTFLSDLGSFITELDLYEANQYTNQLGAYDPKLLYATENSVTYNGNVDTTKNINDLISSLTQNPKYKWQFKVVEGKLVYISSDPDRKDWAEGIGIGVSNAEPIVEISAPDKTLVKQGTDIIYSVNLLSEIPLSKINLSSNVEVLDENNTALSPQPAINIGQISGTDADYLRKLDVTVKTDTLVDGSYKLRVKAGAVTNVNNISNTKDVISLVAFNVDNTAPENPVMSATPTGWTNSNVAVSISYSSDSVVKEYSLDGVNWQNYVGSITVDTNNTTIYARGKDTIGNESGHSTITIANIDKVAPSIVASSGGSTTSSVTINVVTSDVSGSGINANSYKYSKDNGATWIDAANQTSYTFSGLTTGTYQCVAKVTDNAGNTTTSNVVSIATQGLGTIGMLANPTAWTNSDVAVTITYPAEIVTKQYSLDGTTWSTYTGVLTITTNLTVYSKGYDAGNNQTTQATITVANIDKTAPTITAGNGGSTTSSVTVTATATDAGGSGLNTNSYQYSKDNGVTWTASTNVASYTFSGLTTGTYQCKVKVSDNAGSTTTSNVVAIATQGLGTISMVANPTSWTSGNVTVTVTYPAEIVTKQYSLDGTNWNAYTSAITMTANGTVYARGYDAGNNQTVQATITIANIDKIAPTVAFGSNGFTTYAKSRITTATVSDNATVDTSSLKYQWTTSTTAPVEATFATAFTNGATISTPSGASGGYYLWILAKDTAGNTSILRSNIFNLDNTKPVITLIGNNPAGVTVGSAYVDAGASATDNVDGDISTSIQVSSNVNVNVKGSYTVTYNVTDSSGNTATQVTRTVTVIDAVSNYNFTSGSQTFVVPVTGTYILTAVGASGGYTGYNSVGKGALVEGSFLLTQGQVININVGQKGGDGSWPAGGGRRRRNIYI